MPRWPAGLHPAAGAGAAYGYRPGRPVAVPQRDYWRQTVTELFAGAGGVIFNPNPAQPFTPAGGPFAQRASAGPTAAGERWVVRLVQVTLPGLSAAPLVTQQQAAQAAGSTTQPPPPFVAQAWLSVAGVNVHLLAQTNQGGNDTMDLGGQVLTPGEAVTVVWWAAGAAGFPGLGWMALRGTRHTLSAQ